MGLVSVSGRRWVFGLLVAASVLTVLAAVRVLLLPAPVIADTRLIEPAAIPHLRWNWFPAARQAVPVVEAGLQQDSSQLPRASIDAELLGTLISTEGAYAAISTRSRPDGVYREGDRIDGSFVLDEIRVDRVIVLQGGVRQQIPLNDLENATAERVGRIDASREPLIEVNTPPGTGSSAVNLGEVLANMVSAPRIEQLAGGGQGFRLSGLSESALELTDLREGDLVIAVNGLAIDEIMTNTSQHRALSQATSLPVTVLRDEEQVELVVNAASLAARIPARLRAGQVQ